MIKNSLLQIRIDNDLRNNAVALFDEMGMDITSAIRLFLKQTLIRRKLPFEVLSENDSFYSPNNLKRLDESINQLYNGKCQERQFGADESTKKTD